MGGDGAVWGDQSRGGGQSLGFGPDQRGIRAEIGEGLGLRMNFCCGVKSGLKFGERPAVDQDIEGAAPEVTGFPEVGKEGLGDDQMAGLGIELAGEGFRELPLGFQQEALSNSPLDWQAALPEGAPQGFESRVLPVRSGWEMPRVVGLVPTLPVERGEPAITLVGVALTPVVELRPASVEQPGGVPRGGGMIAIGRGMAETRGYATSQAITIRRRSNRRALLERRTGNFTGHAGVRRADRDDKMGGTEAAFEPPGKGGDEAEIDIIPEDGGVVLRHQGHSRQTA